MAHRHLCDTGRHSCERTFCFCFLGTSNTSEAGDVGSLNRKYSALRTSSALIFGSLQQKCGVGQRAPWTSVPMGGCRSHPLAPLFLTLLLEFLCCNGTGSSRASLTTQSYWIISNNPQFIQDGQSGKKNVAKQGNDP